MKNSLKYMVLAGALLFSAMVVFDSTGQAMGTGTMGGGGGNAAGTYATNAPSMSNQGSSSGSGLFSSSYLSKAEGDRCNSCQANCKTKECNNTCWRRYCR